MLWYNNVELSIHLHSLEIRIVLGELNRSGLSFLLVAVCSVVKRRNVDVRLSVDRDLSFRR